MRLFIALELEPSVREKLRQTLAALRLSLDARWIRWVQPDGIHLTLKFLGEVENTRVEALKSAIEAQASQRGVCHFTVGGVGAFPNPARARVLWVGVKDAADGLKGLQAGLEDALGQVGFERENRRYTPHLTLGRVRDGIGRESLAQLAQALTESAPLEPMETSSGTVILVRSELRPGGAVYTIMSRQGLQGSAA